MMRNIFLGVFLASSMLAFGQNTGTGFPPFGSFTTGTEYDFINNQNLNVHFVVPISSLSGRGVNFFFSEINDSQIWQPVVSGGTTAWMPVVDFNGSPTWGWRTMAPNGSLSSTLTITGTCHDPNTNILLTTSTQNNFVFNDAQGTPHPVPAASASLSNVNGVCVVSNVNAYASDASGYYVYMSNNPNGSSGMVVTGPDGTQYLGGSLKDRNGNTISQNVQNSNSSSWIDSTGRTAITVSKSATAVSYTDPNGGSLAVVNLQSISIRTNFACSGVAEYSGSATVPTSIALADGTSFTFSYEETPANPGFYTGRLKNVALPDGGSYEYTYNGSNDGINCSDGSAMNMMRKISDGTTVRSWTFARSGSNTTVTFPQLSYDTAGNTMAYTFDGTGRETIRKVYQGGTSGALLRTVNTTYAANGTPAAVVSILEDGATRSETDTTYDSNGILQTVSFYDFGAGAHGPLIKSISYSYLSSSNSNYAAPRNLIALPSEIQLKDGAGAIKNRVRFNYDETNSLTSCPTGVIQHDDTNYGCGFTFRGNPTSVLTYKDPTTPANPVTRSMTYDVFGNVLVSSLDGVQESSSVFSGITNYSYPDSVTAGPPGGPQMSQSYTYNNALGQVATSTDANGKVTQFAYDDLGRISTITRADLAQTSFAYDAVNRTTTVTSPIDATHNTQNVTAFDKLGRVETSTFADGSGNAVTTVQNQYDELGRLSGRSNPYTGASPSFFSTMQFDALGRVTKSIQPSGQRSLYSYSLQTAIFTDPTGKQIKDKSDALDRLIEVDQPDTTATGGTSATASVAINGILNSASSTIGTSVAAKPASPLTSFVSLSDGSSHLFYIDSNQHISHVSWTITGQWQVQDISYLSGSTAVATNTGLTSVALADGTIHVFFEGPDQHIYQLYSGATWTSQDLTAITGNTLASAGSALGSDAGAAGEPVHVYYLGTNQHIYSLLIGANSTWQNVDLTAATGNTPAAAGSKLAVSVLPDGTTRLFYTGTNQHVYQLVRGNAGGFGAIYQASANSFSDAQSWNLPAYYSSIRLGDVNGDGKADVCGRGSGGVICGLNNGNGNFNAVTQWESNLTDAGGWNQLQYGSTIMLGDINGDGKADVCGRGQSAVYCELSTGTSFGALIVNSNFTDAQGWNQSAYYTSLRLADVNGDGKLDLCGRGSGGVVCALNTGNGAFGTQTQWESAFTDANGYNQSQYGSTMMLADINGDGKADVCFRQVAGIGCALSTGNGFGPAYLATSDFSDAQGWNGGSYYYGSIRLADVNGDGKPDICGRGAAGIYCGLGNGDGTFAPIRLWESSYSDAAGWNQPQYGSTMMFADINGDGRADVCGRGGAGIFCELSTGNAAWQNQDLSAITGNTLVAAGTAISIDPGASAGSPGASGGGIHAYYLGSNQHIYVLAWNTTSLSWQNTDLTAISGNGAGTTTHQPAAGTPLTSLVSNDGYVRLYFLDPSQHIHETSCCSGSQWIDTDLTSFLSAGAAGSGTALTSTGLSAGNSVHIYYLGGTQHINHMYLNSTAGWANQDLTSLAASVVPDSGTVTLTVGGFSATACFGPSTSPGCSGQQQNISVATVAAALTQALNASASPATATVNGGTINLTWKNTGPTNAVIGSLDTSHNNSALFPTPSFTSQSTNFAGGTSTWFNTPLITAYSYNAMDQITSATQGSLTRSASYDALGRMTSYTTPEAGTVSLQYNDANQVTQKTDARNVVTNYTFDALHRLTGTSYVIPNGSSVGASPNVCDPAGGPTPTANTCFFYDQGGAAALALGRLSMTVDPSGSEAFSYDQLGRMTQRRKIVNGANGGNPYITQYQYNLSGALTQIQYPSGRQVNQTYDSLGRLSVLADANTTFANNFAYGTAQQLTGFTYGNGVNASFGFSTEGLLQLNSIQYTHNSQTLFSLGYGHTQNGGNNGQITSITDNVDGGRSAAYLYDVLGRLKQAYTVGSTNYPKWDLAFTFDPYGNRTDETPQSDTSPNATVPSNHVSVIAGTNQITGLSYDASGNTTNDGINTLVYDADNRMVTSSALGATASYVYDGGGVRVKKCQPNCSTPNSSTVYIFSGNQPIAEYDNGAVATAPSREYIYAPSGMLATIDATGVKYQVRDHLSPRMTMDAAGNISGQQGHFPFGELWYANSASSKYRFTTYENDPESGNDYAMARYYINRLCRFNSPDQLGGSMANPQSFNRYAYANNDPINSLDPLGLATCNLNVLIKGGHLSSKQLQALTAELNRIFGTGGADIHVNIATSGAADYTMDIDPQNPGAAGIGTLGYTPWNYVATGLFAHTVSQIFQSRMDYVGAVTHQWSNFSDPAVGQGTVYGRIMAHEMASHGMLGFSHADAEDPTRGFLGTGSKSSGALFAPAPASDSVFSFSAQQGAALHVWCILRTQTFPTVPAGDPGPIPLVAFPDLPDPYLGWLPDPIESVKWRIVPGEEVTWRMLDWAPVDH